MRGGVRWGAEVHPQKFYVEASRNCSTGVQMHFIYMLVNEKAVRIVLYNQNALIEQSLISLIECTPIFRTKKLSDSKLTILNLCTTTLTIVPNILPCTNHLG